MFEEILCPQFKRGKNCVWVVILSILHSFSTSHHDLYAFPPPSSPSLSPHPLHPTFHSLFTQPPHLNSPLHLVTMQIYLSPLTRKTGSSEDAKLAARVPTSSGSTAKPHAKGGGKPQGRKTPPSFSLNLKKNTNSQHTVQDECVYKSPVKSPSQYFQICYWALNKWIGCMHKLCTLKLKIFNFNFEDGLGQIST